MAKSKKAKAFYVCTECGDKSLRWLGQCPSCKAWNSLEEREQSAPSKVPIASTRTNKAISVADIQSTEGDRLSTGLAELDRLFGGGIMAGSVILLGGEPGVGKSTLLLEISRSGRRITYVSGEESLTQVHSRASRLKALNANLEILHETDLGAIVAHLEKEQPELVFIDSVQTVSVERGMAGSISQIREATNHLLEFAKTKQIPVIMTGHITKDGQIAGPKQLEHAVDVVLYFESHNAGQFRFIRSIKNRFGGTGSIAIFEMTEAGLQEVAPERSLVHLDEIGGTGSVLFLQVEGTRVVPLEVQALVTPAGFSNGRRIGEGLDISRIHLIAAILEKYMEFRLSQCDIFVRIRGGTQLSDAGGDLALTLAIASSFLEAPIASGVAVAGEVSLTGQIRRPGHLDQRRQAAGTLQVRRCIWGGDDDGKSALENEAFHRELRAALASVFPSMASQASVAAAKTASR